MPANLLMPKLGMTMVEGTAARWLKREGDQVEKGCPLLEIETEKIVHQIESPISGFLHIIAPEGSVVSCGDICGMVAVSQEEYRSQLGSSQARGSGARGQGSGAVSHQPPTPTERSGARGQGSGVPSHQPPTAPSGHPPHPPRRSSPAARRVANELGVDISLVRGTGPEGRIVEDDVRRYAETRRPPTDSESEKIAVSPVARKLAEEYGVELSDVRGTGPGGRIVREDIVSAAERKAALIAASDLPPTEAPASPDLRRRRVARTIPLTGIRKIVADHMLSSLQTTAQITITMEVDATELVKLRQQLVSEAERTGARIAYNDLIVRAIVEALKDWPIFNSSIEGNEIRIFEDINVGVAMAVDDGVIVPVVHGAEKLSVVEISKLMSAMVEKARSRNLSLDDVTGGTFTLTNLGANDVDAFTPLLNTPESAILGVGRIVERPVVANGQVVIRSMAVLSLSFDHRVADGVPASQFLQTIKRLLERPSVLPI